jgi:hypothetical protein
MNPLNQRKTTILLLLIGLALACFALAPTAQSMRDECASGYVWREARPTDHVCVTPASRDLVARENRAARQRWTGLALTVPTPAYRGMSGVKPSRETTSA